MAIDWTKPIELFEQKDHTNLVEAEFIGHSWATGRPVVRGVLSRRVYEVDDQSRLIGFDWWSVRNKKQKHVRWVSKADIRKGCGKSRYVNVWETDPCNSDDFVKVEWED